MIRSKIFNRIFFSFIVFVVLVVYAFWFFYLKGIVARTEERIISSVTNDALIVEKQVNQFFTLRKSETNILSEMAELKTFLYQSGFLKTKVRGQLERNLIDFAANSDGVERIRIIESKFYVPEPTIMDVKKYHEAFSKGQFEETLVVAKDAEVGDRFDAKYEYKTFLNDPFIAGLIGSSDILYSITTDGDAKYLSVGKIVRDKISSEINGMIVMDLSLPYLRSYFYKPAQSYLKDFSIVNNDNITIFELESGGDLSKTVKAFDISDYKTGLLNLGEVAFKKNLENMGVSFVVEIDSSKARNYIWKTKLFLYALFVGFALISVIISYFLSKSIATPIRNLTQSVNDFDEEHPHKISSDSHIVEMEQLTGAFNKFIDRLETYKKELSLKAHLAAIGQTTSMIAHDVRRPLAGIRAILGVLNEIKNDEETLNKMIAEVDRNVAQTNFMLNDILDFSRDETALELGKYNPKELIATSVQDVLNVKGSMDVEFSYDLKHRNYIHVDGNRIARVLSNIIANALDAMNQKGSVWFKTHDVNETRVALVVGNDGPTIPIEIRQKIFEPFFSYHKKSGSGLGLAICRKIIDMHGGTIELNDASDEKEGKKTEFVLELPAVKGYLTANSSGLIHDAKELIPKKDEALTEVIEGESCYIDIFNRLHKERGEHSYLIIVDDEPLFRVSLRTLISNIHELKGKLTVVEADSAEKALDLLKEGEFEYVITDIDLGIGRMDGYEFVRTVLTQYQKVSVLIHSNKRQNEMDEGIIKIRSPRFLGFMPKPMSEFDVLKFLALKSSLGNKKLLILNDDEAMRLSLKMIFRSSDIEVFEADSVKDAINIFNEGGVSLVLADINLGTDEPQGYEFLKYVRTQKSDVPFYIMSGFPVEDEKKKAKNLGANDYFMTPISNEAIGIIKRQLQ